MSAREKFDAWERGDLQRHAEELEAELERLKAALRAFKLEAHEWYHDPALERLIPLLNAALGEPQP